MSTVHCPRKLLDYVWVKVMFHKWTKKVSVFSKQDLSLVREAKVHAKFELKRHPVLENKTLVVKKFTKISVLPGDGFCGVHPIQFSKMLSEFSRRTIWFARRTSFSNFRLPDDLRWTIVKLLYLESDKVERIIKCCNNASPIDFSWRRWIRAGEHWKYIQTGCSSVGVLLSFELQSTTKRCLENTSWFSEFFFRLCLWFSIPEKRVPR